MNIILILILIAALPILVEMISWTAFYISFDAGRLLPLIKNLKILSDEAESILDCKKDNLFLLENSLNSNMPVSFIKSWEHMRKQIEKHYSGELVPEGKAFFKFNSLVEIAGNRKGTRTLWKCFWIFGALAITLPALTAMLIAPDFFMEGVIFGVSAFVFSAVGWLIFTLLDEMAYYNAEKEYNRFIDGFNKIVPVANEEAALIFESSRKTQIVFEEATEKIVRKFDGFSEETVLPALKESLNFISERQEKGMGKLAAAFATHLTNTLDVRVTSLSKTIAGIQLELTSLKDHLAKNVSGLDDMIGKQRSVLQEAAQNLIQSAENQSRTAIKASELQQMSFESSERLTVQVEKITETVKSLTEQNDIFCHETARIIEEANQTQQNMGNQLKTSQGSIEAAVKESTKLFEGIAQQMKESMADAGKEIALGINEATGNNAEAIEKITEQAKLLREDYESYFSRIETYSKSTYEDLDYHVQNVISRITADVEKMLYDNMKLSQSSLEDFKESNTNLLIAFKEQTNSISLYAKEMNLDVNELSENLKNSVSEFSQSMQGSIGSTMNQFDSGLGELSLRIANIVESICDAVETLPAALEKK